MPWTSISLMSRSWDVPKLRSTRPLACGEWARINSILSSLRALRMMDSLRFRSSSSSTASDTGRVHWPK